MSGSGGGSRAKISAQASGNHARPINTRAMPRCSSNARTRKICLLVEIVAARALLGVRRGSPARRGWRRE